MLTTIQLIAIAQGVFLLAALFVKRQSFAKTPLWLLFGAIVSVMLFIAGDDESNLLSQNVDWFFFDISLFITFLFLFVLYYVSEQKVFNKKHLLYFLPNVFYVIIELFEINPANSELLMLEIFELVIEFSFLLYIIATVYRLLKSKVSRWMIAFMVPLGVLMSADIVNEILGWFEVPVPALFNDAVFSSITLLLVALLFYAITLKLMVSPSDVLLLKKTPKYRTSGLNSTLIADYKQRIVNYMTQVKGYTNSDLSLTKMSQDLEIPKQYISQILNTELNTTFQDFVNGYRVDAFINYLQNDQYAHFALMGIASEVGFKSKSSFYAIFKKIKGLTPAEYKRSLVSA